MQKISRYEALKVLHDTHGKIFAVKFVKKDGTIRMMLARLGVRKNLKKGGNTDGTITAKNNLIRVWDMKKSAYRTVNIKTLLTLKAGGEIYEAV